MTNSTKNPNHYSRWLIEPIDFIRANKLDAVRANIIKYIMRYDAKDGLRDLDKAQQYLNYLREDYLEGLLDREAACTADFEDMIIAERALYEAQ